MVYMDNAATTKMTPAVIQAICCPYPPTNSTAQKGLGRCMPVTESPCPD